MFHPRALWTLKHAQNILMLYESHVVHLKMTIFQVYPENIGVLLNKTLQQDVNWDRKVLSP